MNNYKKFAAKFCGVELLIIALANIVYYVTANNQEPCISRVQDKTETIYRIIYTQTDDRTWVLMDIALGILFLLSVFLICYNLVEHYVHLLPNFLLNIFLFLLSLL